MTRTLFSAVVILTALAQLTVAYPPAPGVVVHGMVRDEYGWLLDRPGAEVVFKVGGVEMARAAIVSDVQFSENYRVLLPVDSGRTGELYRVGALTASDVFTAEIHLLGAVYFPLETLLGGVVLPEAGTTLQLDLTLGADEDGDGLPDDWEYWQLQAAGLFPGHPAYNLDSLGVPGDADHDGSSDFEEYMAGTMAYFAFDSLQLEVVQFLDQGLLELEYTAVIDKAYILEMSDGGQIWVPAPVSLDDPFAPTQSAWIARQSRVQKLYAPADAPVRIFRIRVR